MLELSKWDLDVETNDGEEYTSLVRAVRRNHQRFKLLFVSCSPSQGDKVRHDLMADIPAKKYELLDIKESIDNLYEAINNIPNLPELDVIFIRGLEYSIFEYEDREFGDISKRSQSKVYGGSWAGVPPVLAKLNMQRELFRDRFPHICFVFLLPHFAVDYFIRRAPDFYDWKSGIYRFETDSIDLQLQANKALDIFWELQNHGSYDKISSEQIPGKITEIRSCLDEVTEVDVRWRLLVLLAICYQICNQYSLALNSFDLVLQINPYQEITWCFRGITLVQLNRYEDAIDSYDHAILLKPDNDESWYHRGNALSIVGRYEEAIDSYDHAILLKPDNDESWYHRGNALSILGRYEEAIDSYDRAILLKPDNDESWYHRGNVLHKISRYEDAISSYDHSLQLKPDNDRSWYHRGVLSSILGRHEEAIISYDRAIQLKPDDNKIWYNKASTLHELGRYEDSIDSYNHAIQISPYFYEAWHSKGFAFYKWGKNQEALNAYQHAINIKPEEYLSWHDKGLVLFHISNYDEALTAWQESFNIISKLKPRNTSDLIQEFLDEQLLPKFQEPAVREILPQILTIYTTAQVLPELGVALTRNLKAIQSPTINDYTATEWLKMWQELGKPHPELALALRMLEAGIKYKQNPTDDRVFLSLPQEMRPLLREALGLEPGGRGNV